MNNYFIKKDGFTLGVAKGKANAFKRVKKELEFWGVDHLAKWKGLRCVVNNGGMEEEYTIEVDNGN